MARSTVRFWFSIIVIPTFLVVAVLGYFAWRQSIPGVRAVLEPVPRWIGVKTRSPWISTRCAAASARWRSPQAGPRARGSRQAGLHRPESSAQRVELLINGGTLGLREGGAVLEVRARDGFWRPSAWTTSRGLHTRHPRLHPPSVEVVAATRYWARVAAGSWSSAPGAPRAWRWPSAPSPSGRIRRTAGLQSPRRHRRPPLGLRGGNAHRRRRPGRGGQHHDPERRRRGQGTAIQERRDRREG